MLTEYTDSFVNALQMIYGDGFISAFSEKELDDLLINYDVTGKSLLDIGSGTGGVGVILASKHNCHVTGIDINPNLVAMANKVAERKGLSNLATFKTVDPGLLPFKDDSFDVVLTTDLMVHIDDLDMLCLEISRVLKPNGVMLSAEWLWLKDPKTSEDADLFSKHIPFVFLAPTIKKLEISLRKAGFAEFKIDNYLPRISKNDDEIEKLQGIFMETLVSTVGETISKSRLDSAITRRLAFNKEMLTLGHLYARTSV